MPMPGTHIGVELIVGSQRIQAADAFSFGFEFHFWVLKGLDCCQADCWYGNILIFSRGKHHYGCRWDADDPNLIMEVVLVSGIGITSSDSMRQFELDEFVELKLPHWHLTHEISHLCKRKCSRCQDLPLLWHFLEPVVFWSSSKKKTKFMLWWQNFTRIWG